MRNITFEQLCALEQNTDATLVQLAERLAEHRLHLQDMTALVALCNDQSLEAAQAWVMEQGVVSATELLLPYLTQWLNGQCVS
ncbi:MAG: GTA-gp10 family protein [Rickettsiales bacterium]|nr:GTA-gp10 family protein [Rickettsiales bacterium]